MNLERESRRTRERKRYEVLQRIYQRAEGDCALEMHAREVGTEMGLTPEETFQIVHFLESRGFLAYLGAGPRICITEKGVRYIEREAGRRRSIRDDP